LDAVEFGNFLSKSGELFGSEGKKSLVGLQMKTMTIIASPNLSVCVAVEFAFDV